MSAVKARPSLIRRTVRGLLEVILLVAISIAVASGLQLVRSDPLPLKLPGGAWTLESKALWLSPEQARALVNADALFIDVRPRGEYEEGHVPGAVNLPPDAFFDLYDSFVPWSQGLSLIAYGSAVDPGPLDEVLLELEHKGHGPLLAIPGGWEGWKDAGGSVEEGPDPLLQGDDAWDDGGEEW
jgi:rhodanese-related sulfurtransferase